MSSLFYLRVVPSHSDGGEAEHEMGRFACCFSRFIPRSLAFFRLARYPLRVRGRCARVQNNHEESTRSDYAIE